MMISLSTSIPHAISFVSRTALRSVSLKSMMLSIISLSCFAGEAEVTVSPATQAAMDKIIDSHDEAAVKLYRAYELELAKAQGRIVKDLEKLKADAMKKADLANANAIEAQIVAMKDIEKLGMRVTSDRSQDLRDEGKDPNQLAIVGRWGNAGVVRWIFKADGSGRHYWGTITYSCKWRYEAGAYVVTVVDGPNPIRMLKIVDKNTIEIEPGASYRMK